MPPGGGRRPGPAAGSPGNPARGSTRGDRSATLSWSRHALGLGVQSPLRSADLSAERRSASGTGGQRSPEGSGTSRFVGPRSPGRATPDRLFFEQGGPPGHLGPARAVPPTTRSPGPDLSGGAPARGPGPRPLRPHPRPAPAPRPRPARARGPEGCARREGRPQPHLRSCAEAAGAPRGGGQAPPASPCDPAHAPSGAVSRAAS
jgi:hypothetical protein